MLIAMLDHPDLARRDLSSLQTIMSGAASVPASLVRKTIGLLAASSASCSARPRPTV